MTIINSVYLIFDLALHLENKPEQFFKKEK